MLNQKTLISQVVIQKNIGKRKIELKSAGLIGKEAAAGEKNCKLQVGNASCCEGIWFTHLIISLITRDVRRTQKGANVWVQSTLHSFHSHWSANKISNNNNGVNSS